MKFAYSTALLCLLAWLAPSAPAAAASDTARSIDAVVAERWHKLSKNPLVGRLYDPNAPVGERDRGTLDDLSAAVETEPEILLLGETHDNPEHHWVRSLFAKPGPPKTPWVFEQFDSSQQPAIDKELAGAKPPTLKAFETAIDWEKSGWQKYAYGPLLSAVLDARVPIDAGNIPRKDVMKAAREGAASTEPALAARLALDKPLGEKLNQALLAEIQEAHCNAMPKEALSGMAFAQRLRDASIADAALKAAEKGGSAIVIAGNGHVRRDRGVPWYLRERAPTKAIIAVLLIEVGETETDPERYVPRDPDGRPAADFVLFTPEAKRGDPCDDMPKAPKHEK